MAGSLLKFLKDSRTHRASFSVGRIFSLDFHKQHCGWIRDCGRIARRL